MINTLIDASHIPHYSSKNAETISPLCCEIKKIILIVSSIFMIGGIVAIGALYFTHPSFVTQNMYILLGGVASINGCIALTSLHKILQKKEEVNQVSIAVPATAPPPVVKEAVSLISTSETLEKQKSEGIGAPGEVSVPIKTITKGQEAASFVNWLMQVEKPILDQSTLQPDNILLGEVTKVAPSLLDEPEFYWIHPISQRPPEETKDFIDARHIIEKKLKTHWKKCAVGYPPQVLENTISKLIACPLEDDLSPFAAFQQTLDWFILAPFLTRFFLCLEKDQSQILPWLKKHLEACWKQKFLLLEKCLSAYFKENTPLVLSIGLKLLLPFNALLSKEKSAEKEFFWLSMHRMAFHGIPQLLAGEEKWILWSFKKEIRRAQKQLKVKETILQLTSHKKDKDLFAKKFNSSLVRWSQRLTQTQITMQGAFILHKTTLTYVLPALSYSTIGGELNVGQFVTDIEQIRKQLGPNTPFQETQTFFKDKRKEKKEIVPSYTSLLAFRSRMDTLYAQVTGAQSEIVSVWSQSLSKGPQNSRRKALLDDFGKGKDIWKGHILKIFGNSVASFSDYVVKSYLLAHELPQTISTKEEKKKWMTSAIALLCNTLGQGGISQEDTLKLQGYLDRERDKYLKEYEQLTPIEKETRKLLPLQDGVLLLLILIQSVRYLHQISPLAKQHADVLLNFLEELHVPQISGSLPRIRRKLSLSLTILGILEKALTQKGVVGGIVRVSNVFSKNSVLTGAINQAFGQITGKIKDKGDFKEIKEFLERCARPLFTFLICGAYGKGSEAESALNAFEKQLITSCQALYSFSPEECAQHPERLHIHIREKFTSFLNLK